MPAMALGLQEQVGTLFESLVYGFMGIVFTSIMMAGNPIPLIVVWLIGGALFCTLRFRLLQFRALPLACRLVRGDFNDPSAPGEVTHFQALTSALSVTVGLGTSRESPLPSPSGVLVPCYG